jgi:hypothetical protein
MTLATSSAEPLMLVRYSDALVLVDDALAAEANRLRSALQHFEATCREPGFHMQVSHVADALVQYAQRAHVVDLWVRDVGVGFQLADGGGMYRPLLGAPLRLLPVAAEKTADEVPGESQEDVRQWLAENQGGYGSYEEWKQAFIARFPYLAVAMGLTLTTDQWHKVFDLGYSAFITRADSIRLYRNLRVEDGFAYAGQKIISGGSSLKELAGWSRKLTHLKLPNAYQFGQILNSPNVGNLVGKSALSEMKGVLRPATKLGGLLLIAGIAINGWENWGEYNEEAGFSKVVTGTVVDTSIDLGCTAVGAGVGAVLLGGAGFMIGGPLGAAVGAKIGGFAGGIAGGFYAQEVKKSNLDEELTDALDNMLPDSLDNALDWTGEQLSTATGKAASALSGASAQIGHALAPAIYGIAELF